ARSRAERVHERLDEQLQAAREALRGAHADRVLGAQPLGIDPYTVYPESEGAAYRGALPGQHGESVSRVRRDDDGGPRRDPEQDPSGRADGQGPLRSAARGREEDSDGVLLAAAGARGARPRPRVPEEGRRVQRRPDRLLYRSQGAGDSAGAYVHASD